MPNNPLNPKMEFSPADVLALEVEQWPADEADRNLIPNPYPDPIAYGWTIDGDTAGTVSASQFPNFPSVAEEWSQPMRATNLDSITATAPRVVEIVPWFSPAFLGVGVGDIIFVLNVPELQRPNAPGSEYSLSDPFTSANGAQPQYLTVTAVTSTTITATTENAPPPLTVGPLTLPENAFMRTEGAAFVLESYSDQVGKPFGAPWDVTMSTPDIPVTAGYWFRFGGDIVGHVRALTDADVASDDGHMLTITFRFHDSAGAQVSTVSYTRPGVGTPTLTNTTSPSSLDAISATQVPAGAVSVRFEVKISLSTSTYLTQTRVIMPFSAVKLYQAANSADLPGYKDYVYPPPPIEIFGDISGGLTINREALGACSMSFSLKGDTYDPLQSDILTPGKRVQLLLTDPTTGVVEPLFTGAIADPLFAEYPLINRRIVPITKVTCVDPLPRFASTPHADGSYAWRGIRDILETVPSPSLVQSDVIETEPNDLPFWLDNASVLDHVVIVRDTWQAYAWTDRRGVLRLASRGVIENPAGWTWPPRTFAVDESDFLATMTPSYNSERLINTIRIKALRHIGDQTEEWNYGPYMDAASRTKNGPREATFTVSTDPGLTYGADAFDAYAADILARSSVPELLFSPVPFRILKLDDLARATADLMDVFTITSPAAGYVDVPHRTWTLKHEITLTSWTMTAGFEREYETQTPTLTPSASGNAQRDGEWQTFTKVSPSPSMANVTVEYRVRRGFVEFRTSGNTAASISVPADGNITNQNLTNGLPSTICPETGNWAWVFSLASNSAYLALTPGGTLTLFAVEGTGTALTIASGSAVLGQSPAFPLR